MKMTNQEYSQLVKKASPPSPKAKNFLLAFVVGGLICVIGQLLFEGYDALELGLRESDVRACVSVTLIFLTAVLTGFKVFDNIAKHAGAGTLIPITGFANAVASPAIEFKNEGHVMGVGAKMFTIAGPVIVFGTIASVLYGVILWIFQIV